MVLKKWMILGLAAAMSAGALAQDGGEKKEEEKKPRKSHTYLGVEGGLYMPTHSKIRDVFGSNILVFGISVDDVTHLADKWRLTFDFDFITGEKRGNKFFAAPITASLGKVFGEEKDSYRPYVRFGAGGAYFDYKLKIDGERFSTKRFGASADAEAGILVGDRFRLSAKYQWFSKTDGFEFSGVQITATYQIVRF